MYRTRQLQNHVFWADGAPEIYAEIERGTICWKSWTVLMILEYNEWGFKIIIWYDIGESISPFWDAAMASIYFHMWSLIENI